MDAIVASIQMKLQYAVSGDKIRYKDGKYDLDLTYITPNIIAMAIPGEGVVSAWRNSTADVARFLNTAHGSRYKIFNISQERYRYDLFDGEIDDQFGWPDHHSPPLRLLYDMVMAMDAWQKKDPRQNIIIVHCKAGRSRTGCAIAAYLLHAGICADAESAIKLFNTKRSFYENGVVLPSQIRCVAAFEQLLKVGVKTLDNPRKVFIREIVVAPPILIEGSKKSSTGGSCLPVTVIEHLGNTEPHQTIKRINHPQTWREDGKMRLIVNAYVEGDVQIRILHYANDMSRFTKGMKRIHGVLTGFQTASLYPHIPLFRYTFHTNFINEEEVVLDVSMLDAALAGPLKPNDRVPANLQARFFFEEVDGPLGSNPPLASSANSFADSVLTPPVQENSAPGRRARSQSVLSPTIQSLSPPRPLNSGGPSVGSRPRSRSSAEGMPSLSPNNPFARHTPPAHDALSAPSPPTQVPRTQVPAIAAQQQKQSGSSVYTLLNDLNLSPRPAHQLNNRRLSAPPGSITVNVSKHDDVYIPNTGHLTNPVQQHGGSDLVATSAHHQRPPPTSPRMSQANPLSPSMYPAAATLAIPSQPRAGGVPGSVQPPYPPQQVSIPYSQSPQFRPYPPGGPGTSPYDSNSSNNSGSGYYQPQHTPSQPNYSIPPIGYPPGHSFTGSNNGGYNFLPPPNNPASMPPSMIIPPQGYPPGYYPPPAATGAPPNLEFQMYPSPGY